MKELEGKEVFLKPTGNNARRCDGGKDKYKKATIIKAARVNVTVRLEGYGFDQKFRYDGNRLQSDCNSGYIVFTSEQDIKDNNEVLRLSEIILSEYRYSSRWHSLGLEKIKKIAEILGLDND